MPVVTADEARAVAKDAFVYGYPFVESYKTLHKQALDRSNSDYRAPLNQIASAANVATPADTWVVTPNADTPYSFLWMDLRAEPLVLTMPKIERGRYYSAQLIDLQTFNFAYLGTRAFGNDGGDFLIAGPAWTGEPPTGIKAVVQCETEIAYALFRTQLFNCDDLQNVTKIQSGYKVQPLSRYLGTAAPPAARTIAWPRPSPLMDGPESFFDYLNFLLQFCPVESSETGLRHRFATLGVGAGLTFDFAGLSPELQSAVNAGFADAGRDMAALQRQINTNEVGSWDVFGTRAFLKNNYLYRFAGAKLGLYGNSREEALYPSYFTDADGNPLDASGKRYALRFEKGQLPPAGAFWSFTMYDGRTQLLVANRLDRYLLNSTMLDAFRYGDDGSLSFHVQKDSPGADKESNWLPAPDGPFYCIMRIYMPKPEVIEGRWKNPPLVAVAQQPQQLPTSGIVESRLGKIELKNGYPTDETVRTLYDHIDFQRACQAYLWALPLMAMQEWQREHRETFGAANLDYVDYFSFVDKLGLLTANATTPYLMAFPNMKETGPLVMEVPPGATAGGMTDFWQRPLTDSGQTGPDKGHGGKFLVFGPDDPDIEPPGFYVVRSPTFNVWMAHRTLDPDLEIAKATAGRFRIYPYSQRDNPPPTRHMVPGGRKWTGQQSSGLAY